MQDYVRVLLRSVGTLPGTPDYGVIVMVDEAEERCINILCDTLERDLLIRFFEDRNAHNTESYSFVLKALFDAGNYRQLHLAISLSDAMEPTEFKAEFVDELTDKRCPLETAEAIVLAVQLDVPIYVSRDMMLRQGIPYKPEEKGIRLTLDVLSYPLLQEALDECVRREDYETASKVRDEIRRRFPDKA